MNQTPQIDATAIITNSTIGDYCSIGANTRFCYSSLDPFSYVSVNSNIFSTKIKKFSSISWNVSINPAAHDYNRITQHPILFAKKYGMCPDDKPFYQQYQKCEIGNDCWIGCNSLIMGGGYDWRWSYYWSQRQNYKRCPTICNHDWQQLSFEK